MPTYARPRGWPEQAIGLSIPRLPFLPADTVPPCAGNAETFNTAAEDNRAVTGSRANRRRIVLAEKTAKTICASCPVANGCREYALTTRQRWGVWGGTNPLERLEWSKRNTRSKGDDMLEGKFDRVPTIELFSDAGLRSKKVDGHDAQRKRSIPAVAQGNCPNCLKNPAAIVKQGNHFLWRQHFYKTWGGDTRICAASGVALCAAPEPTAAPHHAGRPVTCPHDTQPGPPDIAA